MTSPPRAAVTIEPLTRERAARDAEALLALGDDLAWDTWTRYQLLAERPGKWRLSLVARRGDAPVAYAVASRKDDAVHLHHIVIGAAERGAGIGHDLLERLRALAADAGARRLTLKVYPTTATRSGSTSARGSAWTAATRPS